MPDLKRSVIGAVGVLVVVAVSTVAVVNADASTEPAAAREAVAAPEGSRRIAFADNARADGRPSCYVSVPDPARTPNTLGTVDVTSTISVWCDATPELFATFIAVDGRMVHDFGMSGTTMASKSDFVQRSTATLPLQASCVLGNWTAIASATVTFVDGSTTSSGETTSAKRTFLDCR